jgi:hypothetical protein
MTCVTPGACVRPALAAADVGATLKTVKIGG